MGFLDKMKSVGTAMTGGAAKVSLEYPHKTLMPGESIQVRVTVVSMGKEVKSGGVFVDIHAVEHGQVKCMTCQKMVNVNNDSVRHAIAISPAFILQPGETKTFESTIQIPSGQPSYHGTVSNEWKIRGRLDAFGNDPDSGFQTIEIR
jgi:sporulation-control protein spo0M